MTPEIWGVLCRRLDNNRAIGLLPAVRCSCNASREVSELGASLARWIMGEGICWTGVSGPLTTGFGEGRLDFLLLGAFSFFGITASVVPGYTALEQRCPNRAR